MSKAEDVESQPQQAMLKEEDVESQNSRPPQPRSLSKCITKLLQGWDFPVFILAISFLQLLLFYTVDTHRLTLLFAYDPHRRHELWRFWTPMFAHNGMEHLWSNVIIQMILGVILEVVHGWKRMGAIYMASVLGGCLFISILTPKYYVVGASAGCLGLLLAHLSTLILNWNEINRKWYRLFWLLSTIGGFLWDELYSQNKNISHEGHFGGALAGFLVSILVLRNFEKLPWEVRMQRICKILLISACLHSLGLFS